MRANRISRKSFLQKAGLSLTGACLPDITHSSSAAMPSSSHFKVGKLLYQNPLSSEKDIKGFRLEGQARIHFPEGRMRMENALDASLGQKSNFVYWCPQELPADIAITWNFYPISEPGLCILFFAAKGRKGEDVLSNTLTQRTGEYEMYHHGDIHALHVSYFRRKYPEERSFHTCNLRKSHGFHLVAQGADPIPSVSDSQPPYKIKLIKVQHEVAFYINDLLLFRWTDDGKSYGPILGGGKIGFRQMAPLIAEYADLQVFEASYQ